MNRSRYGLAHIAESRHREQCADVARHRLLAEGRSAGLRPSLVGRPKSRFALPHGVVAASVEGGLGKGSN